MANPFVDAYIEGAFVTPANRATFHAYIQEKIKVHEAVIRYYKENHNAFTITCQIPPEILGAIFHDVVKYTENSNDASHDTQGKTGVWPVRLGLSRHIDWIRSVSHVCSHWRKVALLTPNLWSNIPVTNPPWAKEMILRSQNFPLTVTYRGTLYCRYSRQPTESYLVLKDLLRSHVSHLKTLTLSIRSSPSIHIYDEYTITEYHISQQKYTALVALLRQPIPMMEYLEIHTPLGAFSKKNKHPNEIVLGSPRLQHLKLEGCGLAWDFSGFRHLRSLEISCPPREVTLSIPQLLGMLLQIPLLESLEVKDFNQSSNFRDMLPTQNTVQIHLSHLEHIVISGRLLDCGFLMDHLIFSGNAHTIIIDLVSTVDDWHDKFPFISLATALARKLDSGIEAPLRQLVLGGCFRCLKTKDTYAELPSLWHPPTIKVLLWEFPREIKAAFWQSFSLSFLSCLDVREPLEDDEWSLFADLPHLRSLRVYSSESPVLRVLWRGMDTKPDTPPAFVALEKLTIVKWNLDLKQRIKRLVTCFRMRQKAGLQLGLLVLIACRAADGEDLDNLRNFITRVVWDDKGDTDDPDYESDAAYSDRN